MANNIDFRVKNGLVVSSTATFQSLAGSTSTTTGALTVTGGVGIGENLYVGRALYVSGSKVVTEATAGGVASLNALTGTVTISVGTDTASYVNTGTKDILIWNTSTLQSVTNRGAVTDNRVTLNNGLILGSTANNPILMNGSYTNIVPGFISAGGTLVGTTETTGIYVSNYQHTLAPVSTTTIGFYGYLMIPTLANTATYGTMHGVFSRIDMNAAATAGSVSTWLGFSSENPIRNAASDVRFTNHYGFRAADPSSITATNVYGYASVIVNSTVSNRWNVYASGSAPNYFNGQVRIGTTATYFGEKLSVNGNTYINGVLTATQSIYATGVVYSAVGSDGLVQVGGGDPNGSITLGNPNRTIAGAPYIDFHSSTSTNDYDSRIIATGGTTTGSGILQITASKLLISSTSSSTSIITGALVINGGVGIGGSLYVGNTVRIQSTVTSTGTTTGALVVTGGVGIGGSVYIANTSYINGAEIVTTATIGNYAVAGGGGGGVGGSGTGTTSTFIIQNYTSATSTNSGALQVWGGAGIGGNLYVGGNIVTLINQYVAFGNNTGTRITRDGTLNGLDLQTAAVSRLFIADTDGAVTIRSTATSAATTNGALVVVGGVGIGGALYAGGLGYFVGSVSAQGTGNFGLGSAGLVTLGAGTDGSIELGAPSRATAGTPFIDFHSSINNNDYDSRIIASGGTGTTTGTGNLTIVASQFIIQGTATSTSTSSGALQVRGGVGIGGAAWIGTTSYVAGSQILTEANLSGFGVSRILAGTDTAINTSTGAVTIWNTSTLQSVTSRGSSTNQVITITNTSSSTGTSTGALRVTGGVGIGGNVYIGRTSYIDGSQIITSATISTFQSLKGQYIPRTAYVATNSLVSVIPSLYDSYVVTAQGGTIVFQIDSTGYTPFDGQKLLIRIYDTTPSNLSWTYGSAQFRTVGISPPQITGNGTIYIGIMYNQTVNQWDILSAVIQ
jgi:hypothetical protein